MLRQTQKNEQSRANIYRERADAAHATEQVEQRSARLDELMSTYEDTFDVLSTDYTARTELLHEQLDRRSKESVKIALEHIATETRGNAVRTMNAMEQNAGTFFSETADDIASHLGRDELEFIGELYTKVRESELNDDVVASAINQAATAHLGAVLNAIIDNDRYQALQALAEDDTVDVSTVISSFSTAKVRTLVRASFDARRFSRLEALVAESGATSQEAHNLLGQFSSSKVKLGVRAALDSDRLAYINQAVAQGQNPKTMPFSSFSSDVVANCARYGHGIAPRAAFQFSFKVSDEPRRPRAAQGANTRYKKTQDANTGASDEPPHVTPIKPEVQTPPTDESLRRDAIRIIDTLSRDKAYSWITSENPDDVMDVIQMVRAKRTESLSSGKPITDAKIYRDYRMEDEQERAKDAPIHRKMFILSAMLNGRYGKDAKLPF